MRFGSGPNIMNGKVNQEVIVWKAVLQDMLTIGHIAVQDWQFVPEVGVGTKIGGCIKQSSREGFVRW